MTIYTVEQLLNTRDIALPSSVWFQMEQSKINAFADVTLDHQFIHVDPDRTRAETALNHTIAHGFFSLSLLSSLASTCFPPVEGAKETINYGMDKLRFLAPVPSDSRIRAHFRLHDCRLKKAGQLLMRYGVSVEIENHDTPALVADWLTLVLFEASVPLG